MIKKLLKYKNTFDLFKKYIIFRKLQSSFNKLSEEEKVIILIDFLTTQQVPILEAVVYYNYNYSAASFLDKLKNTILKEFYRIENNKITNYLPF